MPELLCQSSNMNEILWNFSRNRDQKRLTLRDNPHFYGELPKSPEEYEGRFRSDPIETLQHEEISVLTDNPNLTGRVFLETAKRRRTFGNAWVPNDTIIIFKGPYFFRSLFSRSDTLLDVCGKLEGENIIGSDIQNTPNLWCYVEPPPSNVSGLSLPDRSSPSPTMSAIQSPTTSPTGELMEHWREPIFQMVRSKGVKSNVRISDKSPPSLSPSPSPSYSAPSFSSSPSDSSSSVGSLLPTRQPRPSLGLQIPGASNGPLSPSKTPRDAPLSQRSPAVELSLRSPASPSREPPILHPPTCTAPTPAAPPISGPATR